MTVELVQVEGKLELECFLKKVRVEEVEELEAELMSENFLKQVGVEEPEVEVEVKV